VNEINRLKKRRDFLLQEMTKDISDEAMQKLGQEYQKVQRRLRQARRKPKKSALALKAEANGLHRNTCYTRVEQGMNEKEASEKPLESRSREEMAYWKQVAKENGININTFLSRVYDSKMDIRKAATQKHLSERSKWLAVAKKNGIKENTFDGRVYKQNMSYEQAATKPVSKRPRKTFDDDYLLYGGLEEYADEISQL